MQRYPRNACAQSRPFFLSSSLTFQTPSCPLILIPLENGTGFSSSQATSPRNQGSDDAVSAETIRTPHKICPHQARHRSNDGQMIAVPKRSATQSKPARHSEKLRLPDAWTR